MKERRTIHELLIDGDPGIGDHLAYSALISKPMRITSARLIAQTHDVQPSEMVCSLADHALDVGRGGHVGGNHECAPPSVLDLPTYTFKARMGGRQVVERDVKAILGETQRDCASDATRGASDDSNPAGKRHGWQAVKVQGSAKTGTRRDAQGSAI